MPPSGWPESGVAAAVLSLIIAISAINLGLVLFLVIRRATISAATTYRKNRQRHYAGLVYGTLIGAPDRADFRALTSWTGIRLARAETLVVHGVSVRLRPGDRAVLERMFIRMAMELRGSDRETMTAIFEDAGYVDHQIRRLRSRRWWLRLSAAQKLGVMRSNEATLLLTHTLDDRNRDVRIGALRALGEIGDVRSFDRLLAAMKDERRWEPVLIAEVVLELGPQVSGPILQLMRLTEDHSLQAGCSRLLGLLREPAAVVSLLPLLAVDDELLRLEAVRALGLIGDSRVTSSLMPSLQDANASIRSAAAEALGRIGDQEVVDDLHLLLEDIDRSVSHSAAVALANIGPAGRSTLELAAQASDPPVQLISRQVLAEMEMGLR